MQTNLVFFDLAGTGLTALHIGSRLMEQVIRIVIESATVMRAVFHLDIAAAQAREVADILAKAVSSSH